MTRESGSRWASTVARLFPDESLVRFYKETRLVAEANGSTAAEFSHLGHHVIGRVQEVSFGVVSLLCVGNGS